MEFDHHTVRLTLTAKPQAVSSKAGSEISLSVLMFMYYLMRRKFEFIQNDKRVVQCHTMMAFLVDKYKQSFPLLNSP